MTMTRDEIETHHATYRRVLELAMQKRVQHELTHFVLEHAGLHVEFKDVMGGVIIKCNDVQIDDLPDWNDDEEEGGTICLEWIRPLEDLRTWYCEQSDAMGISIVDCEATG